MALNSSKIIPKMLHPLPNTSDLISIRLLKDYHDNQLTNRLKCSIHTERVMTHYCDDCQSKLCQNCFSLHESHKVSTEQSVVEHKIDNIAKLIEHFSILKAQVEYVTDLCINQEAIIIKDQIIAENEINKVFDNLHKELEKYRTDLIQELQQVVDSCIYRLHVNKEQLEALKDDVSVISNISVSNQPAFNSLDLFELEEHATHKKSSYMAHVPLENLRPNRLNIQVKWNVPISSNEGVAKEFDCSLDKLLMKRPLAKINCHLSPEKLSLLQTATIVKQSIDRSKPYISSICCHDGCFIVTDSSNHRIKVLNQTGELMHTFSGSTKHKLLTPKSCIAIPISQSSTSPSPSTLLRSVSSPSSSVNISNANTATIKSPSKNKKKSSFNNLTVNEDSQRFIVLVADPQSQKVVSFDKEGKAVDVFETDGICEGLCLIPRLRDVESCLSHSYESRLEFLPMYTNVGPTDGDQANVLLEEDLGIDFSTQYDGLISEENRFQTESTTTIKEDEEHLNEPAAFLCSKRPDEVVLECLQINPHNNKLYKSRPDLPLQLNHLVSPDCSPTKLVYNAHSQLFLLLDSYNHRVLFVSSRDLSLFKVYGRHGDGFEELIEPSDVLVDDKDGRVLIADRDNSRIHILDSHGNFENYLVDSRTLQLLQIDQPTAMCWDSEHNLVICELNNTIKIYTY